MMRTSMLLLSIALILASGCSQKNGIVITSYGAKVDAATNNATGINLKNLKMPFPEAKGVLYSNQK